MKISRNNVFLFLISFIMFFSLVGISKVFALAEFPYLNTIDENINTESVTTEDKDTAVIKQGVINKTDKEALVKSDQDAVLQNEHHEFIELGILAVIGIVLVLLRYSLLRYRRRSNCAMRYNKYSIKGNKKTQDKINFNVKNNNLKVKSKSNNKTQMQRVKKGKK